jgi:phosphatidylinositol-bisphosphatase
MVDKRNQDFQDLSKRLVFEVEWPPEDEQEFNYPLPTLGPYESDVLFWMVCNFCLV